MTEEGGVHGSQRVKESAPGFVTFRVIGDNMFGQSWFVQVSYIAQRTFAGSFLILEIEPADSDRVIDLPSSDAHISKFIPWLTRRFMATVTSRYEYKYETQTTSGRDIRTPFERRYGSSTQFTAAGIRHLPSVSNPVSVIYHFAQYTTFKLAHALILRKAKRWSSKRVGRGITN